MWRMADFVRTPNLAVLAGWEKGTPGVMMIGPGRRAPHGRSRLDPAVDTRVSVAELEDSDGADAPLRRAAYIEIDTNPLVRDSINLDPWPVSMKPDNIALVVAGGGHPTHSYWLQAHSPTVPGASYGRRRPSSDCWTRRSGTWAGTCDGNRMREIRGNRRPKHDTRESLRIILEAAG
jgi:hypothetical protein